MPYYVDLTDRGDAMLASECPGRCVRVGLLHCPLEGSVSCSLHLEGGCLPSLWRRICFSLAVVSPRWRSATHDQEIIVGREDLINLREWLSGLEVGDAENAREMVRIDEDGSLTLIFEVDKRSGLAFDIALRLGDGGDGSYWVGIIGTDGVGRWRLAWDNIFNRRYVERWGHLSLGHREIAGIVTWLDATLAEREKK